MKASELVKELDLQPHPEGGFYKEIFRSGFIANTQSLPSDFEGNRNFATSIYFLIENGNFSALHKIKSDETWHFYYGDPLEIFEIDDTGQLTRTILGSDITSNQTFQYTVKANTWFGSRVAEAGAFSLVGCTVYPGFDFHDFELGDRQALLRQHPQHENIINGLTRI